MNNIRPFLRGALIAFCALPITAFGQAQNPTASGEFTAEPPTLVSLGFEWRIQGDDNRNAAVEVSYRRKGQAEWRKGLPLMRSQREEVGGSPAPSADGGGRGALAGGEPGAALGPGRYPLFRYTAANMFVGSIL